MTETALRRASEYDGPVLVHVITRKGFGHAPAEQNEQDQRHPAPAAPKKPPVPGVPKAKDWSDVFGDKMMAIGARRPEVVASRGALVPGSAAEECDAALANVQPGDPAADDHPLGLGRCPRRS